MRKSSRKKMTVREIARLKREENARRIRETLEEYPVYTSKEFLYHITDVRIIHEEFTDDLVDCAMILFHEYFLKYFAERKQWRHCRWVEFPSAELKVLFGQEGYLKNVIKPLIEFGCLKENPKYSAGKFCKSYRIPEEIFGTVDQGYELKTERMCRRYANYLEEKYEKDRKKTKPTTQPDTVFLKGQKETIKKLCKMAAKLDLEPMTQDELLELAKKRLSSKHKCGSWALAAYYRRLQLDTLQFYAKVDRQKRYYTPFTNLPREMRTRITYRGRNLVSLDVKTSQVFCILALIKDIAYNYLDADGTHPERLAKCNFPEIIQSLSSLEKYLKKLTRPLKRASGRVKRSSDSQPCDSWNGFVCREEIEAFERILDADIYDFLIEKAVLVDEYGKPLERGPFKSMKFFQLLYGPIPRRRPHEDNEDVNPLHEVFRCYFPGVYRFFEICKTKGSGKRYYACFPTAMQALESRLILECCRKLMKEHPGIFLTTLHDSIQCLPGDEEKVRQMLETTYRKYLISPKFETEMWS